MCVTESEGGGCFRVSACASERAALEVAEGGSGCVIYGGGETQSVICGVLFIIICSVTQLECIHLVSYTPAHRHGFHTKRMEEAARLHLR